MGLRDYQEKSVTNQGSNVEVTVVPKLNQGITPKKGCNLFRVSFFWLLFLDKQKKVTNNIRDNQ
jgi:hypothetical protein